MSNRSPSVSPLASPLRRMQAAGVVGRINPYCSRRANFRSVKEVKACLSAISDSSIISKKTKSPSSIYSIRTPPNKRSTHNVITPEARSMMKDAVAEFSSPLTDIKKIPIRESPLFPIPASKRRKLFDMRDSILKEVEMRNRMKQKTENEIIIERQNSKDIAVKKHYDRINAEQELRNIQELYPEFSFSNPISLKSKSLTKQSFDGEFIFSNTVSANLTNSGQEIIESKYDKVSPTKPTQSNTTTNISDSTPIIPLVTVDKELAERFRPPVGSWECGVCMINNVSDAMKCVACTADRPASTNSKLQEAKVHVEADKELVDRFRMRSDKWECDTCMIQNSQSDNKCLACGTLKPGSQPPTSPPKQQQQQTTEKTPSNPLSSVKKASTTTVFNLDPSLGSGSSLFQSALNIPGFSLNNKPTENKPNPSNPSLLPLLTSNPISKTTLGLTTLTSANSIKSILPSHINSAVLSTADTPAVSNVISSTITQISGNTIIPTTAVTKAIAQPSVAAPLPFSLQSITPLSKEDTTATTSSLTPIQTTHSLHPVSMPPISPPRSNPSILPITPLKSVEEEAMEVIPFIGTLTTPIKGSSSAPANSPFTFHVKSEATPHPILPPVQSAATQFAATNPPSVNPISFPGIPALPSNSFQFNKTEIPSAFQFSGINPASGTARQIHTDDSTGQKMKLFQFKGASQPSGPFQASAIRITTPQTSNSQPQNTTNPIFPTNQGQILSNLFSSQDKPSSSSLFPQQQQQQQQQTPSFGFPSQVLPGPSMFAQEQQNPIMNVFKPGNVFSPTQKPGFTFSATGSTPQTPAFSFSATQLPNQQATPTTPQTPTYGNFNIGTNQPNSEMSKRVIKTAKRRFPHKQ